MFYILCSYNQVSWRKENVTKKITFSALCILMENDPRASATQAWVDSRAAVLLYQAHLDAFPPKFYLW